MDERAFNKPGQRKEGFQVVIDSSELKAIEKQLESLGELGRTAIMRSINDTLRKGRTIVSRDIREKYSISAKDVKSHLKIKLAGKGQLKGELDASSPMIPLAEFAKGSQRKGVQVEILKGQRALIPEAFQVLLPGGHTGIFRHVPGRTSTGHQKIKEAYSIGTGIMMGHSRAAPQIGEDMAEYFQQRLTHNIEFLLAKAAETSEAAKSPR